LADGADVNAKNKYEQTPLHFAAYKGRKEIAKLLIAAGADENAKDVNGWTPLHRAAEAGHKEIAALLIAKGADVNAQSKTFGIPLDFAIKYKRTAFADLLRKHDGKTAKELKAERALVNDARDGNIEAIR